jgi:D-alanyl-D-alanine carboxypeptidase (penicillin-binding protein 5/6)
VLSLILVGTLAGRAATFQTKAPYALLVDYNTGAVLFEKKADALVAPASTTKIDATQTAIIRLGFDLTHS